MPKLKKKSKPSFVFDTYVLLALLYKETPYQSVVDYLTQAAAHEITLLFNEINVGELYYRVWKDQGKEMAEKALLIISQLPLTYVAIDRAFILAAATWKAQYPISYADAFAAQTAYMFKCPLITNDPEFDAVSGIKIIKLGLTI